MCCLLSSIISSLLAWQDDKLLALGSNSYSYHSACTRPCRVLFPALLSALASSLYFVCLYSVADTKPIMIAFYRSIYCSMVEGHLNQGSFDPEVIKLGPKLVDASIELHRHVMNNFLPSAVKFHYQFNLRELSNITQVCLPYDTAQPVTHQCCTRPSSFFSVSCGMLVVAQADICLLFNSTGQQIAVLRQCQSSRLATNHTYHTYQKKHLPRGAGSAAHEQGLLQGAGQGGPPVGARV